MTRGIENDKYVDLLEVQRQIANRLGNKTLGDVACKCSWVGFTNPLVTPMDRRNNDLLLDAACRIKK